jgi:hypothetical protein
MSEDRDDIEAAKEDAKDALGLDVWGYGWRCRL